VGDPIDCIHDVSTIDGDTFDTFCWVEGTYTKWHYDVRFFFYGCQTGLHNMPKQDKYTK
jgi:hypothetical protein